MNHPASILPPQIVPVRHEQNPLPSFPESEKPVLQSKKPEFITTQQLYDAVFENAFHPMYIGNGGAKVIRFNEKFARLFGFSADEIQKMKPFDFFETNDKSFITFMNQRKEKGIAKAEITGIKKSGERFPCRISSVIYQSDRGEKRSMNTLVNISQNITARWSIAG